MIFYFSGTGNSLAAAKRLLLPGEQLVNMADAWKKSEFSYKLNDNERCGFVFPVYCFTLSDVVLRFVRKLELKGQGYVFAVITCGGNIGHAGGFLKEELKKRGITLSAAFSLPMPDDTVFYYDIDPQEESDKKLRDAEGTIREIKRRIEAGVKRDPGSGGSSRVMRPVYRAISGTRSFWVTDDCIHCGMCQRNCPDDVIRLENGKPVWTRSHCTKCSACINRCPVRAIQYGRKTEGRRRYVNPVLK